MRLRTRGRWGVQAGLLAGIMVAAFFLVVDLVRLVPLSTPLFLSRSLLEAGFTSATQGEGLLDALTNLSQGGRLAAYTAVHLTVFAVLGMFAAALANLFHVGWNARTGAAAGLIAGFGTWLAASQAGPAWLAGAHLTPEIVIGGG
ncbi:MAG: hypothetical protein N2B05_09435, partial [Gemmatimonadales bacterium]